MLKDPCYSTGLTIFRWDSYKFSNFRFLHGLIHQNFQKCLLGSAN